MQQTTNYKLNKPELSDYADITPMSQNMDTIDTQLKEAQNHRENGSIHVTAEKKQEWDGKAPGSLTETVSNHTGNSTIHVTSQDKQKWNGYKTIVSLTHSKSGTTHQLTGLSGVSGIVSAVFTATAGFSAGDTFTVDGTPYTIQLSNGETADDNLFVSGATVSVIIDTAGKKINFKAAGGTKLPAETTAIVAIFTAKYSYSISDTFVVPQTGKYKITVIARGGYADASGGSGASNAAGGGGAGGACDKILELTKGEEYTVSITSSNSSFGNVLSATAGENSASSTGGIGGIGTGGDNNYQGKNGGYGAIGFGGSGGNYSSEDFAKNKYLCSEYLPGGYDEGSGYPPYISVTGFLPFGLGASAGGKYYTQKVDVGGQGAIIIELVLE